MRMLTTQIQKLTSDIENYKSEINKIGEDIKQSKKTEATKEELLSNIRLEIKNFGDVTEEVHKMEAIVKAIREELQSMREDAATNQANITNCQNSIQETVKQIEEAKSLEKKLDKLENYQTWIHGFFIPAVAQIERQVLITIQQTFNDAYRNWYNKLIDDPTKDTKIDEDFTPLVDQDGIDLEIDYLSGGEKTSIALAYRLALNSVMRQELAGMQQSNLLILDEPTDGFSSDQMEKVTDILKNFGSEQIILVSHDPKMEGCANSAFKVVKSNGTSKISKIKG